MEYNICTNAVNIYTLSRRKIEESKSTKITNIILYYILQIILVVSFLGIILTSLCITKVNDSKWEKELINLYNDIENYKVQKLKKYIFQ